MSSAQVCFCYEGGASCLGALNWHQSLSLSQGEKIALPRGGKSVLRKEEKGRRSFKTVLYTLISDGDSGKKKGEGNRR